MKTTFPKNAENISKPIAKRTALDPKGLYSCGFMTQAPTVTGSVGS